MNFHPNYLNLNKEYIERRRKNADQLAKEWLKALEEKIMKIIEEVRRGKFMQKVKDGHRLTVNELGELRQDWKDDYFNYILNMDSSLQEYIEDTHAKALVMHQDFCKDA